LGRVGERTVIELVLVGVALGELGNRLIEAVALAEVSADRDPVAGSGMGTGQRPAAHLPVYLQPLGRQSLDLDRSLPVPKLAHVEVSVFVVPPERRKPAEKNIACGLHQPLALDHSFAVVAELARPDV